MCTAAQLALFAVCSLQAQSLKDLSTVTPIPVGDTLIIGFLGGYERWNDPNRSVRRLTLKLRNLPNTHAESFGNHHQSAALQFITKALDTDGNRKLDPAETAHARIIIFGQSLGGNATIQLARALAKKKIPVLLTVQVDSVGIHDYLIPANVKAAVNFYQHELLTFQGQSKIRASNPKLTTILANQQFHYPITAPGPTPESWPRRVFGGAHARMEADPILWAEVETFIHQAAAKK